MPSALRPDPVKDLAGPPTVRYVFGPYIMMCLVVKG